MENIFLKQLASKQTESISQQDLNSPYSFIEWKQRRPTYAEEDVVYHYNQYVVDWFNKNKTKSVSQKFLLRQKYLYLLSQLQLFFSEQEKNDWYNKINIADEKELLLAIPYFAKKLKAITFYYLKLRKKLKNVKLKYNLVGTETGLEQQIQNRLLEVFSSLNTELPPEISNHLPTVEELKQNLTVKIEQLYDDSVYFDRDPTVALSAYYDPFHELTAQFFATKGLTLSSDDWIFNTFNVPITSDLQSYVDSLTGSLLEASDSALYGAFIQKFLNEDKYLTSFGAASSTVTTYNIPIAAGSNNFYYPYGTSVTPLTGSQLPLVALSSISLSGATSSTSISGADTIQVKIGNDIKSAWLEYIDFTEDVKTLRSDFKEANTSFIFPFPGYGLSAEDIDWTGPSLSSTPEYYFLTKTYKDSVNSAYWSQFLPSDSTEPIGINETTLVKNGAFASFIPNKADKILIKTRVDGEQSALSLSAAAWLYKPEKTSIPISITTTVSALLWPYEYVNPNTPVLPDHLKPLTLEETIAPIEVNDLYVPFAVATDNFKTAEKIYKLQKPGSLAISAIDCCWLYSPTLTSDHYIYNAQGGLSMFVSPGEVVKFIWAGPNNTPLSSVFGFTSHSAYCPFTVRDETDPEKCLCKQVYYSPLGHNGSSFLNYNSTADYIAVDTANNLEPFVLGAWKDSLSGTYENSSEFAWYKTERTPSWGFGEWVTTSGNAPFLLEKGKAYFYKRSSSLLANYPSYVVSFQYPDDNTLWLQAKLTPTGEWISTGEQSNMKLYAGDLLKWDKQPNNTSRLISAVSVEVFPENVNGNIWTPIDFIPLSSAAFESTPITWPAFPQPAWSNPELQYSLYDPEYPLYDSQYPQISGIPITLTDVVRIYWWKVTRQPTIDQFKRTKYTAWTEYDVVPFGVPVTLTWATTSTEEAMAHSQYPMNFNTGVPITSADVEQIYWWKLTVDYKDNELVYPYYIYENTFVPRLPGTYSIEVSAKLTNGEDYYFTDIPTIYVAPLQSEYMYDSYFASFAPYLTGTYTVEVSARVRLNEEGIPRISSLSALRDRVLYEEDYHFTNIPPLSVVPLYRDDHIEIEIEQPVSGYILTQTLSGWNSTTNTYDLTSTGGKPYWAVLNTTSSGGVNFIDGYLPDFSYKASPITLEYGDVVEYQRADKRFVWNQPLNYSTSVQSAQWTALTSTSANNFSPEQFVLSGSNRSPVSDIVLSNTINGRPVEIYYNSKNSFVWPITIETPSDFSATSQSLFGVGLPSLPSTVLSNRFYPTIATVPVAENLYTEEESGGFFTHSKLGASQYINDNFSIEISSKVFRESTITENVSAHIGGRGLTKKDQDTIYTWSENNQWLKEPPTSNQLAGAVKKSLTKTFQTFVPYQNNEEKQFGLVTPSSRVSPWGGKLEDEWTDTLNEPKSFTGVRNVSAWVESQVLKQNQKVMDNWVTDIFGNQYGLFKTISDDQVSIYDRANTTGQLWVKTNDQLVNPAYVSLSSVFEPFKSINSTIYKQLTGEGIVNIDCFFDTLVLETPSAVLYAKVRYNYETGQVEGLLDNTRFKYLTNTNNLSVSFGQSWFFETEKKAYNLFTTISSGNLMPEIYELSLTTNIFSKKFPYNSEEQTLLLQALSGLSVQSVDRGLLTHNKLLKQSLITIVGTLTNSEPFLVDIVINDREDLTIHSVTIYTDTKHRPIPFSTQTKVTSGYFYETVPLSFAPTDTIQIYAKDYVTLSVSAINDPTYFELVNYTSNLTAFNDGTFIAYFETPGLYQVNYKVGNDAGFNLGCLTLSAISREDVILLNGQEGFLVLDGYNGRYII